MFALMETENFEWKVNNTQCDDVTNGNIGEEFKQQKKNKKKIKKMR